MIIPLTEIRCHAARQLIKVAGHPAWATIVLDAVSHIYQYASYLFSQCSSDAIGYYVIAMQV